jgi:hypothetical protein
VYASLAMTTAVTLGMVLSGPSLIYRVKPNPAGPGAGSEFYGYYAWAHGAGKGGRARGTGGGGTSGGADSTEPACLAPGPYPSMGACGGNGALYGITLPQTPGTPAPTVSPAQLAALAYQQLVIPVPTISTAPPRGHDGLVGLPEFFWADRAQWRPLNRRAEAGGVWAEVTAVPSRLVVRPGDGSSVACAGPGVPYDLGRSPDAQDTGCTHLYQRSSAGLANSAYSVTANAVWTATWVGSGGSGGALPPTTRSVSFPLRVAEGQALVQGRS